MKKTTVTIMILVIQTLLFGQNYNTTIGIKLNPGVATIYNPIINLNYARFSKSVGLELRQRIMKDKFYLETGVYFFDRGFGGKVSYTDAFGNYLGEGTLQEIQYYLSVPISLIFKYKRLYIGAGPNINYFLARRFINDGELISTDKSYQTNDIIFGGQLFVGYEFNLSNKLLLAFDGFVNPTIKVRFLNFGLGIGLKYVLKKNEKE